MIYLDIDGVIILAGERGYEPQVKDRAMMVRSLANQSGCDIVISSHRRRSDDVIRLLQDLGLDSFLPKTNWKTPFLGDDDLDPDLPVRGQEIAAHLISTNPDSYVIFDDDTCLIGQNHVQIDPCIGITQASIDSAILLFNQQKR